MIIATVRGIVIYKEKLLCVQQSGHKFWCLPGGKVDEGESIEDAFRREMVEELGVEPEIGDLLYIHQFSHHDGREFLEFFIKVDNPEDYLEVDLAATTHGELELDAVSFLNPETEDMMPTFLSEEAPEYMNDTFTRTRYRFED